MATIAAASGFVGGSIGVSKFIYDIHDVVMNEERSLTTRKITHISMCLVTSIGLGISGFFLFHSVPLMIGLIGTSYFMLSIKFCDIKKKIAAPAVSTAAFATASTAAKDDFEIHPPVLITIKETDDFHKNTRLKIRDITLKAIASKLWGNESKG